MKYENKIISEVDAFQIKRKHKKSREELPQWAKKLLGKKLEYDQEDGLYYFIPKKPKGREGKYFIYYYTKTPRKPSYFIEQNKKNKIKKIIMGKISYRTKTHKGWVSIEIDLVAFMDCFKKTSPEYYVKRGNKNEVKGKIDKFGKFIEQVNKDVVPAEFYFLIDHKTFKPKLIVVNGRHRMAWLLENGCKWAVISIPKVQLPMFSEFNLAVKNNVKDTEL